MKKLILTFLFCNVAFLSAQEENNIKADSIETIEKKTHYIDKVLFKDANLTIFRRQDNYGNDFVQIAFGETSPPIEISKDGSIKANRLLVPTSNQPYNYSEGESYSDNATENYIDIVDSQKDLERQVAILTRLVNEQDKLIRNQLNEIDELKKEIKKIKIVMVNK